MTHTWDQTTDRPARLGGWAAVRRLAPVWVAIPLVASGLAGFATGDGNDERKAPPAAVPAPATETSRPATESTKRIVGPVVKRLDKRRTAERRRLRAARFAAGQKTVATDLARVYRDARRSILRAPHKAASEDRLADHLQGVERAYRGLATAVRRGSGAWRLASEEVLDRERDLELLLRRHSWS